MPLRLSLSLRWSCISHVKDFHCERHIGFLWSVLLRCERPWVDRFLKGGDQGHQAADVEAQHRQMSRRDCCTVPEFRSTGRANECQDMQKVLVMQLRDTTILMHRKLSRHYPVLVVPPSWCREHSAFEKSRLQLWFSLFTTAALKTFVKAVTARHLLSSSATRV